MPKQTDVARIVDWSAPAMANRETMELSRMPQPEIDRGMVERKNTVGKINRKFDKGS